MTKQSTWQKQQKCVSGSCDNIAEDYILLGYDGPSQGIQFLTFQDHIAAFKATRREVMKYVILHSKFMKYNYLFTGLYHTTYNDETVPLVTLIF
jgi:hypothetical protein